jgi:hypothetical protein
MGEPSVPSKKIVRMRTFKDDMALVSDAPLQSSEADGKTTVTPLPSRTITPPRKTITPPQSKSAPAKVFAPRPTQASRDVPLSAKTNQKEILKSLTESDLASIKGAPQQSILSDRDTIHSGHELGEGTIVRDTRHKRFRLIPAMIAAVSGWFADTKVAYQESAKKETHTVAKAETRLETIRKAIQEERIAPKDDTREVAKILAQTPRTTIQTGIQVKEKETEPTPSWTHVAGEIPESSSVQTEEIEATKQEEVLPIVTPATKYVQEVSLPTTPEQEIIPEVETENLIEVVASSKPVHMPEPLPSVALTQRRVPMSEGRFYLVFAGVIFCTTLLGVGVSYYLFGTSVDTGVVVKNEETLTPTKLFPSSAEEEVLLQSSGEALIDTLAERLSENNTTGLLHFIPTLESGAGTLEAGTTRIFESLAFRTQGSFVRNVEAIAFGAYGREAFVLMQVDTFDTAFAGILAWESAMSADLSPLFGEPVYESFSPEARTASQTTEPYFRDIIAGNKNARVLVNENNDDRIIYTFIDQRTILITTTRETLAEILPLIE